jgi:hypothetical protein
MRPAHRRPIQEQLVEGQRLKPGREHAAATARVAVTDDDEFLP